MRTFSEAVRSQLARKHGLQVEVFVGVTWDGGKEFYYSSSEFDGAHQAVVSISGLETTKQISGNGASQSVTVTLSDTDGFIKRTLDTTDIHKQPARIYLGFPNVPIDQAIILIDGEINSELQWNERARTLSLSILDKIEG